MGWDFGFGSWLYSGVEKVEHAVEDRVHGVETAIKDKFAMQAMLQREVQMAVNIARARDSLMWFGSLYTTFTAVVTTAKLAGKPVPAVAAVPVVMGGFALANLADMAYGTKLTRVVKEAEHIMESERYRFVPMKQAPFEKFYTVDERAQFAGDAKAVGSYWPSFVPVARPPPA